MPIAKTHSAAGKPDWDVRQQQLIDQVNSDLTAASNQKAIAQTVVTSLTTRLTTAKALLAATQARASAAGVAVAKGRVAAQTALSVLSQARAALDRSEEIRKELWDVYAHAHQVGLLTAEAARAVDGFAQNVESRKAKNEYVSANVVGGIGEMRKGARAAVASAVLAVQSAMVALARAEQAVATATAVVREATHVLTVLLPPPPDVSPADLAKHYDNPTAGLLDAPLYVDDPPSLSALAGRIADAKPQDTTNGLLYLLDALEQIIDQQRKDLAEHTGEVRMELNDGQHRLEQASRLYESLQAAKAAAVTAAIG